MLTRCSVAVATVALCATAQTTHVVQGGGAALQTAIASAAPGDILDVMPGSYSSITVARGIRIQLRSGAEITAPFLSTVPAVSVTGLPRGEACVIAGGRVHGVAATGCAGAVVCDSVQLHDAVDRILLTCTACTGPMVFHQVATNAVVPSFGAVTFTDCAQVSCTTARLPRTTVTNSFVTLTDVTMRPYGGSFQTGTMPTLHVRSGHVSITGGRIDGGVAASWPFHESGIQLDQGEVVLTGGALVQESPPFFSPLTVPAINTAGGRLRIDPSVTLVGTPAIAGPAAVVFATTPGLEVLRAAGSVSYQVTLRGEPNSLAFTLIGLPQPALPSPFGVLWLDPMSPILDVTTMPAGGATTFSRAHTNVPPFLTLALQSATLSPTASIAVSPPVRFVWN